MKYPITNSFSCRIFIILSACILGVNCVRSQNIAIGSIADDVLQSLQLAGKFDSLTSFTVRPAGNTRKSLLPSIYSQIDPTDKTKYLQPLYFAGKLVRFTVLPFTLTQQFNSHHPYGWNDGAMIAAKGYQALASAGFYVSVGPLEIQAQPEIVYAANPLYESTAQYGPSSTAKYKKMFPGQSSVRLSIGALSAGVSTQNLWWGPGKKSSLLMSNNAPGFLHAFIGSNRPMKTGIGSFEWQLIGGKLTSDESMPYENFNLTQQSLIHDWRYLNALIITYHPKWVPGLFLGFTRALQRYNSDLDIPPNSLIDKYLPVLNLPFEKKNSTTDDDQRTDQLASFFLRWLLAKANAEVYVEYGFNDYGVNIRDYLMAPTHSAAYLAGFKKMIQLPRPNERMELGFELTQMTQSPDYLIRNAGNWYEHGQIRQGYTHGNQILGAGAGFGANVQSLTVSWIKGWKQLGLLLERVERDPLNHTYNWVDFGIGILPQYKYDHFVFSGKFQFIRSDQYAWQKDENRFNLHARLILQYLF